MLTSFRNNTVNSLPCHGMPFLLNRLAPLLLVVLSLPPATQAQSSRELQNLVFDPVLIEVIPQADSADDAVENPAYDVRELTPLPAGEAIDLQSWFFARRNSSAPSDPESLATAISGYEQAIAALEVSGGAYEPRLSQELLSLGTLLQGAGDYSRAREVFERASHVNRVNYGLYNLEQIPIIEKTIENYLAEGDLLAADEQQQYLFYLQRKSLGDLSVDLLPALTRYAEWNVYAFNSRVYAKSVDDGEEEYRQASPAEAGISLESFRTRSLVNAQNIYHSIIRILMSNYGISDPRLLDVEKRLALTNYFFATSFMGSSNLVSASSMAYTTSQLPYEVSSVTNNSLGYREGREALERRVRYMLQMDGITPRQLAEARLDHGDWLLVFNKRMGALEVFGDAWQQMVAADVPASEIDALFNPPLPEQIPEFLAHSNTRSSLGIPADIALEYKGYVDIEYTVNRFGTSEAVNVLGKSASASDAIVERLERNIRRAQFRPRYDNGMPREEDRIRARYYFAW